ncbi:MAG: type IV pilin protein [Burkholderiaceae bacterium]
MTNFQTVQPSPPSYRPHGFTLIELMVTVAIVAILAAVAIPSYQQYVIRGHRTAAQAQMMDIANRQQQYLLANRAYATKSALEAGGYVLPSEVGARYSYDITGLAEPNALPTFSIVFTPIRGQAGDGELVLTSEGDKSPAGKW